MLFQVFRPEIRNHPVVLMPLAAGDEKVADPQPCVGSEGLRLILGDADKNPAGDVATVKHGLGGQSLDQTATGPGQVIGGRTHAPGGSGRRLHWTGIGASVDA